jgi:hypothetical protein
VNPEEFSGKNPELQRMAQQAVVLGQPQPKQRQWVCPKCGDRPPTVQYKPHPASPFIIGPAAQYTQLSDEPGVQYGCSRCFVEWQRKNIPALVEVDPETGKPLVPPPQNVTPMGNRESRRKKKGR